MANIFVALTSVSQDGLPRVPRTRRCWHNFGHAVFFPLGLHEGKSLSSTIPLTFYLSSNDQVFHSFFSNDVAKEF